MIGRVILKDYASAMKPDTIYYRSLFYEDGDIKRIEITIPEASHNNGCINIKMMEKDSFIYDMR